MALNFPSSPSDNDRYNANGIEYYYSASVGAWLVVVPSLTANTLNLQIVFNDSGFANGSNGLLFNKGSNTFYTNTAIITNNVTAQYFIGDGSALTGIAGAGLANNTGTLEGNLTVKYELTTVSNVVTFGTCFAIRANGDVYITGGQVNML